MLHITILAIGKMHESCWREAQELYSTRLSPYVKLSIEEVTAEPLGSTVSDVEVLKREGERLLKRIPDGAMVVAFDKGGNSFDSVQFANFLDEQGVHGGHVVFIIGGSIGLDDAVLKKAQWKLSLSKMTFTHEMARVLILEQTYRAMMILKGKEYHK